MCTDGNDDKNKTNLPPSPSTLVAVIIIAEKLLSLWLWNFQTFGLFLLSVLLKIKHNCVSGFFCIAGLSKVGRKKHFLKFYGLTPPSQNKVKYSHNKC